MNLNQSIADVIHYPSYWDVAQYPTLQSAVRLLWQVARPVLDDERSYQRCLQLLADSHDLIS